MSALAILPFEIRGFHTDNGSEYINQYVAGMLDKLSAEFTKSRSRHSNDNALVESKNGSVIRKHFGYSHIPQHWASQLNDAIQEPLYRYQNFHKPCFFPVVITDDKGKERKKYPYSSMMRPYEKLISLDNIEDYLKDGITLAQLAKYALSMTDQEAAKRLQQAKREIFSKIFKTNVVLS